MTEDAVTRGWLAYPELYMYLVYQLASYHTVVSGWVGRVQFRLIVRSAETSSRGTAATSG
jgi:hypothetical protein